MSWRFPYARSPQSKTKKRNKNVVLVLFPLHLMVGCEDDRHKVPMSRDGAGRRPSVRRRKFCDVFLDVSVVISPKCKLISSRGSSPEIFFFFRRMTQLYDEDQKPENKTKNLNICLFFAPVG